MQPPTNPNVTDVFDKFTTLDTHGTPQHFSTEHVFEPSALVRIGHHIQGCVRYGDYYLLSYNDPWWDEPQPPSDENQGLLVILNNNDKEAKQVVGMPFADDYPHPGGMQVIGDYLVVGLEPKDHDKSKIVFYDLSTMTDTKPPTYCDDLTIDQPSAGAGAVGITQLLDHGAFVGYALASYDNGACTFYWLGPDYFPSGDTVTEMYTTELASGGYSSVQLITDDNSGKWLVGFRRVDEGREDWVDLYKFSIDPSTPPPSLEPVENGSIQFYFHHWLDRVSGFRFGAGLHIEADGDFWFCATDRNPLMWKLDINRFDPPAPPPPGV